MSDLKTTYQNDALDTSKNTQRVFDVVDASGNVLYSGVHFVDKTVYTQTGDSFGADDINDTNTAVNLVTATATNLTNGLATANDKIANRMVKVKEGVINGVLIASGEYITLEDGAMYMLTGLSHLKSTGAYRGMQTYVINSHIGNGSTTTAQGVAKTASLLSSGTVGMNVSNTCVAYESESGATLYRSRIGIGSCTTDCSVRYSLWKIVGSEDDFE